MNRTYSGAGTLIVDGAQHPCRYELTTTVRNGIGDGRGIIEGTSAALFAAIQGSSVTVQMSDGRHFDLIVTSYSGGAQQSPFQMNGPIY